MSVLLILLWLLTCQAQFDDEMQAYEQYCHGEDVYACLDGTCIERLDYCDGFEDCEDGSDENSCLHLEDPKSCNRSLNFLCEDSKMCIMNFLVCNNVTDCSDGSDEKNCSFTESHDISANASCKGYTCDGNKCISALWMCDGHIDCADETDELVDTCKRTHTHAYMLDMKNCDSVKKNVTGVYKNYMCPDQSFCLPSEMMCDGIVDCRDGADEGTFCNKWHTMCSSNPCKGKNTKCVPERDGFFCICDGGSDQQYNYTTNQCEHTNECEWARPYCSHTCHVNKSEVNCLCDKGYTAEKSLCHAEGEEAKLFYSTKNEIGFFRLKTKEHVSLASGIKETHGVIYDGKFVYWVDTEKGHQAIMRAERTDVPGTLQVLVSLGLEEPGNVALDWLGGHIYFSDAKKGIIAACLTDGSMCVKLPVNANNPKYVTLAVKYGKMYWADWHQKPVIMTAQMDGSGSELLLGNLRNFATGLTLDVPNNRLYYVDRTIKVIKLDDRQTYSLFSDPFHHPYAVAVFENTVYWSDIISHSIKTTDKMNGNGEGRGLLVQLNSSIFDMHIYHPILLRQLDHTSPCLNKSCSHLCLLTSNVTSVCACPEGMRLNGTDCVHIQENVQPYLIIGAGADFTRVQYNTLGNPEAHTTRIKMGRVGAMAYDNVRDTLYIYDSIYKTIDSIKMNEFKLGVTENLLNRGIIDVVDMDYDYSTHSLYILDAGRGFMEVVSLRTRERALLYRFRDDEIPISFCVIPNYGKMLVAIRDSNGDIYIDSMGMDGSDRKHIVTNKLAGPVIRLRYAYSIDSVYFTDEGNRIIDFINPDGDDRKNFNSIATSATSLEVTETYLFWTDRSTPSLYWADIYDAMRRTRKIELSMFPNGTHLHIQVTRPPPSRNNVLLNHPCLRDPCSAVCVQTPHSHLDRTKELTFGYKCLCPVSLLLKDGKCVKLAMCRQHELYCHKSNDCVLKAMRCDGKMDCKFGEDEEGCDKPTTINVTDVTEIVNVTRMENATGKPNACGPQEISCDGSCIDKKLTCNHKKQENETAQCDETEWPCETDSLCVERSQVCNGRSDCPDGSDENSAICDTLTCLDTEFMCTAGHCILSSFTCDGELDCLDGSDEENCGEKTCAVGYFQCHNRRCVEMYKRCDGQHDCVDSSDEHNCGESYYEEDKDVIHCAEEEYACERNKSICLPATARCNWMVDCPGGTDEEGCDHHCAPRGKFRCGADFKCIHMTNVCDGKKECSDGSDESPEACQYVNRTSHHHISPTSLMQECIDGYLCGTGDMCLRWSRVCDDIIDCRDWSDENGICSTACEGTVCSHICHPTPQGPRCTCPPGLQLLNDHRTCVDLDECVYEVCSQKCHNIPGTFLCSCHHGYTLRSDHRSCKVVQGNMSYLYVSGNKVHSLSVEGNTELEYTSPARIGAIDTNIREQKLYVTVPDAGKLIQVTGPNATVNEIGVTNIGTPTKVAVDWLTGNVYFVDSGSNSKSSCIRVCNMDKKKCAVLPQTALGVGVEIVDLVIDPASRRMFYCTIHEDKSIVYSLSLSGRRHTDLASVGNCTGLAVDSYRRRLYVAKIGPAEITMMNFFGDKDKTVVISLPYLNAPHNLVIFEDWVYFLVANTMKVSRCRLYGAKTCHAYIDYMFEAQSFVIRHQSVQRIDLTNVCADYVCSNICVLDDAGPQCMCYDGTISQDGNCLDAPNEDLIAVFDDTPEAYPHVKKVTIAVTVVILFLVAIFMAFYVYKKYVERRTKTRNCPSVGYVKTLSRTASAGPSMETPTNVEQKNWMSECPQWMMMMKTPTRIPPPIQSQSCVIWTLSVQ